MQNESLEILVTKIRCSTQEKSFLELGEEGRRNKFFYSKLDIECARRLRYWQMCQHNSRRSRESFIVGTIFIQMKYLDRVSCKS